MSVFDKINEKRKENEAAASEIREDAAQAADTRKASPSEVAAARAASANEEFKDTQIAQQPVTTESGVGKTRTFLLKTGKEHTVPITWPNGQVVPVKFTNGSVTLTGRPSDVFYQEYLANAVLRTKVKLVDADVADEIARKYKEQTGKAAKTGGDTAGGDVPLHKAMEQDATLRRLQRQAEDIGEVEEVQLQSELKTATGN